MSIHSIAQAADRQLLRVFKAVSVTCFKRHFECRYKLEVRCISLSGRLIYLETFVDEMAAEDRTYADYIVRDVVQQVVTFVTESNPRSFM